jgi:hypothetical protein
MIQVILDRKTGDVAIATPNDEPLDIMEAQYIFQIATIKLNGQAMLNINNALKKEQGLGIIRPPS